MNESAPLVHNAHDEEQLSVELGNPIGVEIRSVLQSRRSPEIGPDISLVCH